ncbi:cytochrome b5 type B, isoform CRA_b [Rattus norvegicus]|uniref:Cytochrome b5 type B, isoform CRA_b n=1 Tax=Rattus norvegicus TaxID=10116 RepID=A6IYZ4_RAT|nr:cytochrome b5 type B, isoform CRA_b [Rattus norvegicus]
MATPEASGSGRNGQGSDPAVTYYRLEEVAKRNTAEETWMVIHGRVYDITRFLSEKRFYWNKLVPMQLKALKMSATPLMPGRC